MSNSTEPASIEAKASDYKPPKGVAQKFANYSAESDWIVLRKGDDPLAEMFFTAYLAEKKNSARPLTFVFNGGPGAASAYLHVGALGPKRVFFEDSGALPPPPVKLVDNLESWLEFTDLIFVDPIGTGFSRTVRLKGDKKPEATPSPQAPPAASSLDTVGSPGSEENKEFYQMNRDLDSLGEFIQRCLTRYSRWTSPVYIAGESYGGFRVAKLTRRLQENFGVGLSGAILISPALEFGLFYGTDYDVQIWADLFPSFVGAAWAHKQGIFEKGDIPLEKALNLAEEFSIGPLSRLLAGGGYVAPPEATAIYERYSELTGLDKDYVALKHARISAPDFVRRLKSRERLVCGLYDASVTTVDPFPDRDQFQGPEPTLSAIDRVFNSGINALLRDWLQVKTERDYRLLSLDVNRCWKIDNKAHDTFWPHPGAMDDLRYGMCLNPHMKVFITHGYFDLVTPYFSSNRLATLMRLTDEQKAKLTIRHFQGGHMFYSWTKSRQDFTSAIRRFMGDEARPL